ncbi:MAG: divalent metal cation transporter [Symbiopectobacterium sp.]
MPQLPTSNAVLLAAGVLEASIMPNVIYLHSSLTQQGKDHTRCRTLSCDQNRCGDGHCRIYQSDNDVLSTTAAAFHFIGNQDIADLERACLILDPLIRDVAATIFGLNLVTAWFSSTVEGTLAD